MRRNREPRVGSIALMAGPLVLMLVVGGVVAYGGLDDGRQGQATAPQPATGQTLPPFALPALAAGAPGLADADLRGQVSVVNFWASWCLPCREEMPLLQELAAVPGVTLFGINSNDRPVAARRFLAAAGDPFARIGVDADGSLARAWGAYGLPATFVITAEGRVAHALIGPLDRGAIERDILPLLAP